MRRRWLREIVPGVAVVLFVGLPASIIYLSPDAQKAVESQLASFGPILLVVVGNLVLFGLAVWFFRFSSSEPISLPPDQIAMHLTGGDLLIDAPSVCDQVYLAVSKVPGVRVLEVSTRGEGGRAYIEVKAVVDSLSQLPPKAEAIRSAIRALAKEQLHIDLGAEPSLIMRIKPLKLKPEKPANKPATPPYSGGIFSRLGRTSESSGIFGSFKPEDPLEHPKPSIPPSIFGTRPPHGTFDSSFRAAKPPADEPPSAFSDFLDHLFDGDPDDGPDDKPDAPGLPF